MNNGKIYIGSSNDILRRWRSHIRDLVSNKHANIHMQRAWTKHGPDSFSFTVIENINLPIVELRHREQELILNLKSTDPMYGYNMLDVTCIGGINAKKVAAYDNMGKLVKTWNSLFDASSEVGLTSATRISKACKNNVRAANMYWRYFTDKPEPEIYTRNTPRCILKKLDTKIYVFDKNGIHILLTDTIIELCEILGVNASVISEIRSGRKITYKGMFIIFSKCIEDAMRELSILKSKEDIRANNRKAQILNLCESNRNKNKKPVISITADGKEEQYNSVTEAASKNNISKSSITQAIIKNHNASGKKWRYL